MADWRTIDDGAPKDGTAVLGYLPGKRGFVTAQDRIPIYWSGWGGGCWTTICGGHLQSWEVTHWQPLPAPPDV